jgi:Domain of unknown function (DUF3510)
MIALTIRAFRDKHGEAVKAYLSSPSTWLTDIVEDITLYFAQQIQSLTETVKQMDTALQRRQTKARPGATAGLNTGANASVTDSEKIFMQVSYDVAAYGQEIATLLGVDPITVPAYGSLLSCVEEAKMVSKDATQGNANV